MPAHPTNPSHRASSHNLVPGTRYSLLAPRSSLLAPRSSLLAPRSSLLATRSSLLATWHSHLAPGTRQPLDTLLPTAGREGAGARGSGVATRPTTAQAVHSGGRHPNPGGGRSHATTRLHLSTRPTFSKTHAVTTRASATLANACCRHPRVSYAAKAMQRVLCPPRGARSAGSTTPGEGLAGLYPRTEPGGYLGGTIPP